MKTDADELFQHKKFKAALTKYYSIQYRKPGDMEVRLKIGACNFFVNEPEQAKKYLHYVLENAKNPSPETYFFLGRVYHAELNFKEAVKFYKTYLKNTKSNHPNRRWIKDEVRRCASGIRQVAKDQQAIIENLGEKVNSIGDDFAPILSPNYDDKIYFSSSRRGNRGGLRNDDGFRDDKFGDYNADMFSTQVVNGEWTATTPMNPLLNSSRHDVVLGFNEEGSVLYFFKGPSSYSGEVLIDTFRTESGRPLVPTSLRSPMLVENGDGQPFFFNDSIFIFSSAREGGYGGRDLYIAKYSNGQWSEAQNLGPTINSKYNETTPFLSKDGRTLYFSSNNLNSMGGLDIFKSDFDDVSEQWSEPENMGYPINSAADDAYFKLSRDGYKGYFSSSRIDGIGKQDIYVAYFRSQRREQLQTLNPVAFSEVRAFKYGKQSGVSAAMQTPNSGEGTVSTISAREFSEEEISTHKIVPLFYNKDDQVLNYKNKNQLNKIARLLLQYPQLKLILTSNSDGGAPLNFDLYFSLKRANTAAEYLVQNGVNPNNILVKGCGANYPIAKVESEAGFIAQASRLNRRIDIDILNTTGLPIRIEKENPTVNNRIKTDLGNYYRTAIQGLSYKVQIAAIKQMYNGDIITMYPDAVVESDGTGDLYRYSIGLYQTFSAAAELRKELIRQGVMDAFVVPYVNGLRVNKDDSKIYSAAYPDLINFLNYSD